MRGWLLVFACAIAQTAHAQEEPGQPKLPATEEPERELDLEPDSEPTPDQEDVDRALERFEPEGWGEARTATSASSCPREADDEYREAFDMLVRGLFEHAQRRLDF